MNIVKLMTLVIFYFWTMVSWGGDYNCRGGTPIECSKSCVSIGDCQHPCTAVYNPSCRIGGGGTGGGGGEVKIQNCSVASIYNLGYGGSGNKHEFCLNSGWNGGQESEYCWKFPSNPAVDCPRLNSFYNSVGQSRRCDHLTVEDAVKLHVCGR